MFTSFNTLMSARDTLARYVKDTRAANELLAYFVGRGTWDALVAAIKDGSIAYSPDWIIGVDERYSTWLLSNDEHAPAFDQVFVDDAPVPESALTNMEPDDAMKLVASTRHPFHFDCRMHDDIRHSRRCTVLEASVKDADTGDNLDIEIVVAPGMNDSDSLVMVEFWSAIVTTDGSPAFATAHGTIVRSRVARRLTKAEAIRAADVYTDDLVSLMEAFTRTTRLHGQFAYVEYLHVAQRKRRKGLASTLLATVARTLESVRKRRTPTALMLDASMFTDAKHFPSLDADTLRMLTAATVNACFARVVRQKLGFKNDIVVVEYVHKLGYYQTLLMAHAAFKGDEDTRELPPEADLKKAVFQLMTSTENTTIH